MVKIKVVLKERDAWSDLANFIGEMVAKYAEAMDLDSLPDPDHYLLMKRIKQLSVEFYKEKNIENPEMQNSLLKEKLSYDIITVKTDMQITKYGYMWNVDGGKL